MVQRPIPCVTVYTCKTPKKCCYDVCDFLFFPNFGTILFWPISLLIISSGSSGLFTFGCFILCLFENLSRDKLEKGPSKFLAYIRNTIPAKSLWPPSEESPPPLPLFQCKMMSTFLWIFFSICKTTLGRGYGGKGSHCPMLLFEIVNPQVPQGIHSHILMMREAPNVFGVSEILAKGIFLGL